MPTMAIHDVCCQGSCRHQSAEECTATTQVVFPYRGVYVRHLGQDQTVAEANQVLFFNSADARVSHGPRPYLLAMKAPEEAVRAAAD